MLGRLEEEREQQVLAAWKTALHAAGLERRLLAALELFERFTLDVAISGGTQEANSQLAHAVSGMDEDEEDEEEEDDGEEEETEEEEEEDITSFSMTEDVVEITQLENDPNLEQTKKVRIVGEKLIDSKKQTARNNYSLPMVVHCQIPNIRIWTLEGCSAMSFTAQQNISGQARQQVLYDVLVVLTSELHQEDHLMLTAAFNVRGQPLFLVCAEHEMDLIQEKLEGACKTCAWERMRDRNLEIQRRRRSPSLSEDSQNQPKLVKLMEIGGLLLKVLPDLRKRTFSQFVVDVSQELRESSKTKNDKMSVISTALETGKMTKEDLDQISEISHPKDLTEHPSRLLSVLNAMEHFKLAIGVLGVTGCGSSSLINALLGLTDGAEGSAPTGITETTKEPVAYPHPTLPNVVLWDLPGVGAIGGLSSLSSAEVPAVPNPCDVYILLCPLRLTVDCLNLLQSLQALGKECYLVLSKMDQVDEEDLKEVKGWSEKAVEQLGLHRAVFLVSALQPEGMDLPKLKDTLCSAFPHHRRVALASYVPKLLEQNVQKRPDLCKTM